MPTPKLRLAIVTTHPPGKGSLNEYAYHFVRLRQRKRSAGLPCWWISCRRASLCV